MSSIRSWPSSIPSAVETNPAPACWFAWLMRQPCDLAGAAPNAGWKLVGWPGVMIIGFSLALQSLHFTGLAGSDDVHYFHVAEQMRSGVRAPLADLPVGHVYFSRWIVWQLVRVGTDVFPRSVLGVILPFILSSLASLLLVIVLGRQMLSGRFGYVPGVLLAATPLFINLASVALPEPPAMALAWSGIALSWGCLLRENARGAAVRMWAAGFLIAMAYSAKESAAIFVPCLLLFVLLFRRRETWAWRRTAWLGLGTLCWLAIDAWLLYRWAGDPFFRMHAVRTNLVEHELRDVSTWSALLHHWSYYARVFLSVRSELGFAGPVLLAAVLYAPIWGNDAMRLLLCLVLPTLLYLSAGSADLTSYAVLPQHPRYLMLLLPALALAAGLAIQHVWRRGWWTRAILLMAAVHLGLSCSVAPRQWTGNISVASTVEAARRLLSSHPELQGSDRLLVSDYAYYRLSALPYFMACPAIQPVQEMPRTVEEWTARFPGAYVMTTRFDRNGPLNAKQTSRTFKGAPLAALALTAHAGRAAPPLDRLDSIRAWLTGAPEPLNAQGGVDLWQIPRK